MKSILKCFLPGFTIDMSYQYPKQSFSTEKTSNFRKIEKFVIEIQKKIFYPVGQILPPPPLGRIVKIFQNFLVTILPKGTEFAPLKELIRIYFYLGGCKYTFLVRQPDYGNDNDSVGA